MNCEACGKSHYGFCKDESIPLSKRLDTPVWVDGDRISDYMEDVLLPSARKSVIAQVKRMEKELAALKE